MAGRDHGGLLVGMSVILWCILAMLYLAVRRLEDILEALTQAGVGV